MTTWSVPGYTAIQELGRGASGTVILATHDQTGVPVAIKYLADNLKTDETFLREFRAEARILAEVADDHVSRLYEYVEDAGGAAIVMELVNGVALRKILREQGPTEPEAALVVLKGSLLGLSASHQHGIVHRDYKPENVLVDTQGQSKLADFGIAVRVGRSGALAGTPSYMAPEQWTGGPATTQTDIYAATATFFECLTGQPPFRAPGDLVQLRRQHESAPIPVDAVPEPVRGLLRRGLAKDPEQRPKNAAIFVRELEAVAGGAYGPAWEEEGKKKLARRALLLAALFPLALASMSGTAVADTGLGIGHGFGRGFRQLSSGVKRAILAGTTTVVLVGGGVGGCVALNPSDASDTSTLPSSSPSVELTLDATPTDLPSESPSASPSASPSPSVSPTRSPTRRPSTKPTSASPSPKPSPSIIRLGAGGAPSPSPTCGIACSTVWYVNISSTAYYGGYGTAVLHIGLYNPNLAPLWGPNGYSFTINGSGHFTKSLSLRSQEACGDYKTAIIKAWVTIGTSTVKEVSSTINCYS